MNAVKLKKKFNERGLTFSQWARDNGYTPNEVLKVVNGFTKCKYGKNHEIAVKLGLKQGLKQ